MVPLWLLTAVAPLAAQDDAIALQRRAIARIEAYLDHARKTLDVQSRLPELAQADVELSASNRALEARGDWTALAFGLIKQGNVHRIQGQWEKAIPLYGQAEEAAKRAGSTLHQSDALGWRALAESSRGNVGAALADATEALRLAETVDDPDVLARALGVLGEAQLGQGDFASAANTFDREVAAAARAKEPLAPYHAYVNRHDVYLKSAGRCDYQRAFQECHRALDRARADLDEALRIVERLGYPGFVSLTRELMADVDRRRALVGVQQEMQGAVERDSTFHPRTPADVLVTERFAGGFLPSKEIAQAYEEHKRSQAQAGRFADVVQMDAHFVEGLVQQGQGEHDSALASFLKAIEILERDRLSLRDERSRGTYMEARVGVYYAAIQQLLERRRYAEAFDLFERSRSRALTDLLASRAPELTRAEEQGIYAELTMLRGQIAEAQGKLFELGGQPDTGETASRRSELQMRIRGLEDRHRQVTARMARDAPRLASLVASKPATLEALQASMRRERYELLQYLIVEHGVLLWHIMADTVVVQNVWLPRTQVMTKVAALRSSLTDREAREATFDETTAQELFLYLVQPALKRIRSERLVIIPHEDLQYLPFQVLKNPADGRYLGERFQITYAPSVSVLLGLKRQSSLSGGRLLAVGDPGIEDETGEVEAIAKLFPASSRIVSDALAPESEVKRSVRDFDVIHLSVHGKFNAVEPMLSYLSLAATAQDDGQLTAAEMFGLALGHSRLVVLSACETGRAEATHGNEVLGMVRALIYAGAGSLILSYWKVDSKATALWMRSFYQAARSKSMPEAARIALSTVKSTPEYSHPYYWAAFAMVGR